MLDEKRYENSSVLVPGVLGTIGALLILAADIVYNIYGGKEVGKGLYISTYFGDLSVSPMVGRHFRDISGTETGRPDVVFVSLSHFCISRLHSKCASSFFISLLCSHARGSRDRDKFNFRSSAEGGVDDAWICEANLFRSEHYRADNCCVDNDSDPDGKEFVSPMDGGAYSHLSNGWFVSLGSADSRPFRSGRAFYSERLHVSCVFGGDKGGP
jgi:hypothetical protein